ncbi:hypothetical protein E2542_SST16907 [Spatholobus suberectus]|nr:hypothetical protein E2542_SST16907 [Spatholobus suberectus]
MELYETLNMETQDRVLAASCVPKLAFAKTDETALSSGVGISCWIILESFNYIQYLYIYILIYACEIIVCFWRNVKAT